MKKVIVSALVAATIIGGGLSASASVSPEKTKKVSFVDTQKVDQVAPAAVPAAAALAGAAAAGFVGGMAYEAGRDAYAWAKGKYQARFEPSPSPEIIPYSEVIFN